ncbi:MAG: DUF362 domain-containing protein [bacterium]
MKLDLYDKLSVIKTPVADYPKSNDGSYKWYPELCQLSITGKKIFLNSIYKSIRELFHLLSLDEKNYGTKNWNPLGEIIKSGDKVLIKPNLVKHEKGEATGCVMTHASVLRPIVDYCLIALKGKGKITICDVPLQSADFELVKRQTGLDQLMSFYSKFDVPVELLDLRVHSAISDDHGFFVRLEKNPHNEDDFVEIDLAAESMLEGITNEGNVQFAVDDYAVDKMKEFHNKGIHKYLIPKKILDADVVINVPKLKTHQKAGITVSLKNLIGINAGKERLPHFRRGLNGDEYYGKNILKLINSHIRFYLQNRNRALWNLGLKTWRTMVKFEQKIRNHPNNGHGNKSPAASLAIKHGAWHGNDTVWRTILDVNRILFYATIRGEMTEKKQRHYFSIVDGIIAGEGNGPINPKPKPVGVLLAGFDPVLVDCLAARLMGFDPEKIPQLKNAFSPHKYPITNLTQKRLKDIEVLSNESDYNGYLFGIKHSYLEFEPPPGWINFIEITSLVDS